MILVGNLILVSTKTASAPDVVLTQPWEGVFEDGISSSGGRWVAVFQATVIDGYNFVSRLDQLGVDGAYESVQNNLGPCACGTAQFGFFLVYWLVLTLGDFEHEGPVGTALGVGGSSRGV